MPLTTGKEQFKTDVSILLESLFSNSGSMTPAQARTQFVNGLADAVEDFIKSADGIYQTGKLTAGANVVTAVGSPAIKLQ